jgi:hypothetical protein
LEEKLVAKNWRLTGVLVAAGARSGRIVDALVNASAALVAGFFMRGRMAVMPLFTIKDILLATTIIAAWLAMVKSGPTLAAFCLFALYHGLIIYQLYAIGERQK